MLHCENFVPVPARSQIYLTKTAREPAALALALSKLAGEDTDWPVNSVATDLYIVLCLCHCQSANSAGVLKRSRYSTVRPYTLP